MGNPAELGRSWHAAKEGAASARQREAELKGRSDTVRESVSAAQRELGAPNYRDIDSRFRKQLIELETTKMATTDLEKFHKARCWLSSGFKVKTLERALVRNARV